MRNARDIANELLVLKAQSGDRAAFDALVRHWSPIILRYCLRLTQDPDIAQDAMQTCWLRAIKALKSLDDAACFPAWILRIASHVSTDTLRRKIRHRKTDHALAQLPTPDTASFMHDVLDLRTAIAGLRADERILVGMFYGQGLGIAQIAIMLGVPEGTIKSRLYAVRKELRTFMEGEQND
ncbi:MAG: sigma-70 family RNA polymerase sigma factor [Robiginitomaculum sp.]|nr:sigma-70 family RNA polymerase sigma factor [Robiginitomaculum sp.]MDQ7078181.1 sigma-70 family RNA polymerase sigma factor [Robiginitomaculum sp.]